MISTFGPLTSGVAVGGNGVATANQTSTAILNGVLYGIYVKYLDSPPAGTTDVTIATAGVGNSAPAQTLLTITDAATDGWFYPRVNIDTDAGAAIATQYDRFAVDDLIKVTIAQANAGDYVQVWLLTEK